MKRRTALASIAAGLTGLAFRRRLFAEIAESAKTSHDYFVFVHAQGGWDVTLWSDPRNERKGIVDPPSNANSDIGSIKHWKAVTLDGSVKTFEPISPAGSSLRFGPSIGDLFDLHDRLTIINGIAMNTVSHDDGTVYSITGRHRAGSVIPASSIDVMVTSELGASQLMPDVSIMYPSSFVGANLDHRAIPLRAATVDALTRSFARADGYLDASDREAMSTMLADEARELAGTSAAPASYVELSSQHATLPKLLDPAFVTALSSSTLAKAYPQLPGPAGLQAAFALEAIKRDLVRTVAFGSGGFDTHHANYHGHAARLQELFDVIAGMVKLAEATPHPTLPGAKLGDRLHILVLSEFCRTPYLNQAHGRDHYPNNSALVISPRFKRGRAFGDTDLEQLLPREQALPGGKRMITPSDVLATFLGAFGIDPRRHMRDGDVIRDWLA